MRADGDLSARVAEELRLARGAGAPAERAVAITACAADLVAEPIDWLWSGWLARGKMHILGGQPGVGKTSLAMSLAATVSRGGRWPDGSAAPVGNVIVFSCEDDASDVLMPKLVAAGANLRRVHFITGTRTGTDIRSFDATRDIGLLAEKIAEIGGASLLVIDPIVSAVAGNSHQNAEVRRDLQPLVDLARTERLALLGITHLSKGSAGRDPIDRLVGSLAFGALARVVLLAAKPQDADGGQRLLCRAKSNIGPDDGGYFYDLQGVVLPDHPGLEPQAIVWRGAATGTARELLAEADSADDGSGGTLGEAKQFLSSLLEDGPTPSATVRRDSEGAGLSWATIRRASKALRVEIYKVGQRGGWAWRLPAGEGVEEFFEDAQKVQDAHAKRLSTLEKLEHLGTGSAAEVI